MKLMNKINQVVALEDMKAHKGQVVENVFLQKGIMYGKVRLNGVGDKVELRHINGVWIPRKLSLDKLKLM